MPVPVRLDVWGELLALSDTLKVPVRVPVCVGVKVTLILQLVFAASVLPQVVEETLKSPLADGLMPVSVTLCLLARVNTLAALVTPTFVAE